MIPKKIMNNFIEFSPLCIGRLKKSDSLDQALLHVDTLHLDIMDDSFVPSSAFSVSEVNNFKCEKPKHVHIMSKNINDYIDRLFNIESISFHYEATSDHQNLIAKIKKKKIKTGLVLKSETQISEVKSLLPLLDRVILMAVPPGFSGQKFIEKTTNKIKELRNLDNNIHIVIDGGMNEETMFEVTSAGANSCVVCSVIIKSDDIKKKILRLKEMCKKGNFEYLNQ
ncbi:ribulose-phosphate 3-epimerase [Candidatus Pelagibacter ubique]|nr:ribulose-phosphate 3-epimerase [Candidatus Pelagibacter ubique]